MAPHTATADDASWDSGTLNHRESWFHTFETEGVWAYHSDIHPSMTGTITLESDSNGTEKFSWGEIKTLFE
ncbi:hypothetical protein KAU45_09920 [bacterium]|nr:hypothetical protein [bacterium]